MTIKKLFTILLSAFALTNCSTNTVTGRKQLILFPEPTLQAEAETQYRTFLVQNKIVNASTSQDAEMVRRVGTRIAKAIETYYVKNPDISAELKKYKWEFNLIESKEVNAWCMPGGKVVVYTGLLPISKNEAGLSIVLGHEITHAIAKHGNERMSQVAVGQGLEVAGDIFTRNKTEANSIFNNVFAPSAAIVVLLPNSRNQEYEADHYGLIFSALAGYDPRESIAFWKRMSAASGGQKIPEFLATHPSDANRIEKLEGYMNEALSYYKPVK